MARLLRLMATATVAAMCVAPAAHAQGCVLCYTSLAAAGSSAMHAFQVAMLVLLVPALFLFAAVFGLIAYRARIASESA